jgi:hypothetical protein
VQGSSTWNHPLTDAFRVRVERTRAAAKKRTAPSKPLPVPQSSAVATSRDVNDQSGSSSALSESDVSATSRDSPREPERRPSPASKRSPRPAAKSVPSGNSQMSAAVSATDRDSPRQSAPPVAASPKRMTHGSFLAVTARVTNPAPVTERSPGPRSPEGARSPLREEAVRQPDLTDDDEDDAIMRPFDDSDLRQARAEVNRWRERTEDLTLQLDTMRERATRAETRLVEDAGAKKRLESNLREVEERFARLELDSEAALDKVRKAAEATADMQISKERALREEAEARLRQIGESESDKVQRAQADASSARREADDLRARTRTLEREGRDAQGELAKQRHEMETLREQLLGAQGELASERKRVESVKRQLDEAKGNLVAVQERCALAEREQASSNADLELLRKDLAEERRRGESALESSSTQQREEVERLSKELREARGREGEAKREAREHADKLKEALARHEAERTKAKEDYQHAVEQLEAERDDALRKAKAAIRDADMVREQMDANSKRHHDEMMEQRKAMEESASKRVSELQEATERRVEAIQLELRRATQELSEARAAAEAKFSKLAAESQQTAAAAEMAVAEARRRENEAVEQRMEAVTKAEKAQADSSHSVAMLEKVKSDQSAALAKARAEVDSLKHSLEVAQEREREARELVETLRVDDRVAQADRRRAEAEEQAAKALAAADSLRMQLSRLREEHGAQARLLNRARSEAVEAAQVRARVEADVMIRRVEETARQLNAELAGQREAHAREIARLHGDLEHLRKERDAKELQAREAEVSLRSFLDRASASFLASRQQAAELTDSPHTSQVAATMTAAATAASVAAAMSQPRADSAWSHHKPVPATAPPPAPPPVGYPARTDSSFLSASAHRLSKLREENERAVTLALSRIREGVTPRVLPVESMRAASHVAFDVSDAEEARARVKAARAHRDSSALVGLTGGTESEVFADTSRFSSSSFRQGGTGPRASAWLQPGYSQSKYGLVS